MELKSNQMQKNVIDCLEGANAFVQGDAPAFYFAELSSYGFDFLDLDCDVCDYGDVLAGCVSLLENSASARLMLKEASEKDWRVCFDDLGGSDYMLDVEERLLILDHHDLDPSSLARSAYFKNAMLVTMVKGLRDIWQEKRYGGFDEHYSPDYILLMERIRASDLDVLAIMVAWELRAEGCNDIWRHVIGSEIGDMAMVFAGHLERDPCADFYNFALRAVFQQWFRCDARVNGCDHDSLEYMDEVLEFAGGDNPFGRKKPSKMNIEILSCLPDKSAYLQGMGAEILSDPAYMAVDHEINQTHLFHIMYDLEAVVVENVPFRDQALARKIFPESL